MKNSVFWSWNGKIEKKEVIRQINEMAEQGIHSFFIHARSGLTTEYMGEEWFDRVADSIHTASSLGIDVWLYDENGWPSGKADGKLLKMGDDYLSKGLIFSTDYDLEKKDRMVASYQKSGEEYLLIDGEKLQGDTADLYVYYDPYPRDVDRLNPRVAEAFIENVHEVYKKRYAQYFGKEIKGIFFDEPAIPYNDSKKQFPWSLSLVKAYRTLFGGELLKDLWKLYFNEAESAFLYRFNRAVEYAFRNNFVKKIQAWCTENNLLCAGHFCVEEGVHFSFKTCGDLMMNYKEMDVPGIDILGRRITSPLLPRQLSSIVNQFDKKLSLCECFGCCGWDAEFSQLMWTWNAIASQGVNFPCVHLFAYSIAEEQKYDFPMFLSPQNTWWGHTRTLLEQMDFINEHVSKGVSANDVLVLSPLLSCLGLKFEGLEACEISDRFRTLLEALNDTQVLYDLGDELVMEESGSVEGNRLKIGRMSYSTVVVPKCVSIEKSTLRLLKEFYKNGGKLLFIDSFPRLCAFEKSAELEEFIQTLSCDNSVYVGHSSVRVLRKLFDCIDYRRIVKVVDGQYGKLAKEVILNVRRCGDELAITIFNQSTSDSKDIWLIADTFRALYAERVGLRKRKPLDTFRTENGCCASLTLSPGECLTLTACKKEATADVRLILREKRSVALEKLTVEDNWFTMDHACVCVDGKEAKERYVGKFGKTEYTKNATATYTFTVEDELPSLFIIAEAGTCQDVLFNGVSLKGKEIGWEIDPAMIKYDVVKYAVVGENTLRLVFDKQQNKGVCFIGAIYLKGAFDVKADIIGRYPTHYVTQTQFALTKKSPIKEGFGDITAQNMWFYRGSAEYRFTLAYNGGREKLSFGKTKGVVLSVLVNGKEAFDVMDYTKTYDLTEYLQEGNNEVCVRLYSSNRNLLGTHHHILGSPNMIGYENFRGNPSFTDYVICRNLVKNGGLYQQNYAFDIFGIDNMYISHYEEEKV